MMDTNHSRNHDVSDVILKLIEMSGGAKDSFEADLVKQQIENSLRMLSDGHNTGQLKLMTRAMKEMRYAYRIFNEYPDARRISIFGSARTPEDHPEYKAAEAFSRAIADEGWMCITGAANGIMKAGMAGMSKENRFGLSIRLPFETQTNHFLEGDPKLIHFRYFFTRKLMFMSHSHAAAVFPGGFGTQDELFEMLTLIQTGRSSIVPIVLVEAPNGNYWPHWKAYVEANLVREAKINKEDQSFYHLASSVEDAVSHIQKFYRRYHSSRYVGEMFVIRLTSPLSQSAIDALNRRFSRLVRSGKIESQPALPEEKDHLSMPRLVFHHTRADFGLLRQLIDAINESEL